MTTTKAKHTPGPWSTRQGFNDVAIDAPNANIVTLAIVNSLQGYSDKAECEANARLIAKAPEMAELLREVLAALKVSADYIRDLREVVAQYRTVTRPLSANKELGLTPPQKQIVTSMREAERLLAEIEG